jgi:hypothetical protein
MQMATAPSKKQARKLPMPPNPRKKGQRIPRQQGMQKKTIIKSFSRVANPDTHGKKEGIRT